MELRLTVLLLLVVSYQGGTAAKDDWGYTGEKGPHKWPEKFDQCAGQSQSPININTETSTFEPSLSKIRVSMPHESNGRMILIHNGHTLQVNTIGKYYMTEGSLPSKYTMAQFHFHWGKHNHKGSEHQFDGKSYPLELHVVAFDGETHRSIIEAMRAPMGLAVLGTLFTISDDDNPVLEPIIEAVKEISDPDERDTTQIVTLPLRNLLPRSTGRYYRYNGSLTTPHCFESVVWTVFEETQHISKRQIKALREILKPSSHHHKGLKPHEREKLVDNFRPVQPLNGRKVLRSFLRKGEVPTAAMKSKHAVWSYKGDTGPANWKEIYPDAGCAGVSQSPINIVEHKTVYDSSLGDFEIQTPPVNTHPQMMALNNGHTIKIQVEAGDYFVHGGGLPDRTNYKIAQLHFHWGGEDNKGSEHHVNGHAYPIELHIVTYDSRSYDTIQDAATQPQGLAVLGVLFEIDHEDNLALEPVMSVMDSVVDPEVGEKVEINALNIQGLLPEDTSRFFRYNGSLTTPGCFESVVWTVFKDTQKLSHRQLRHFRAILKHQDGHEDGYKTTDGSHPPSEGTKPNKEMVKIGDILRERLVNNYRPIQPLNNRTVLRSYKDIGPEYWGGMDARCKGRQQSPINIVKSKTVYNPQLKEVTFYDSENKLSEMSIVNNGHTVQINVKEGIHYVFGGGLPSSYQTVQLHFHWGSSNYRGSEHTINGKSFPLELHVVNYDASKYATILEAIDKPQGLAVLGVLFYVSKEDNEALEPFLDSFPDVIDPDDKTEKIIESVAIESLMPQDKRKFYRYNGSLTTPGCFESVVWTVFEQKLPISTSQMEKFRRILLPTEKLDKDNHSGHHDDHSSTSHDTAASETVSRTPTGTDSTGHKVRPKMVDNFRPVQSLNSRTVWRSFRFSGEKKKGHGWGYEGDSGPEHWSQMFPDKKCDGNQQSPININRRKTQFDHSLRDVNVWFDPPLPGSKMVIKNNGHTVQVNVKGKYFITGAGLTKIYKTAQFHFHWGGAENRGSEHTMDGKAYPLELHIVNYDSETYNSITEAVTQPMGLAVFGVFYEISDDDNPVLEAIIDALSDIEDPNEKREVELKPISVKYLLPEDRSRYYRYNGSLTTPGCYESVVWTLFEQPQTLSRRQLKKFWNMFQMEHEESHSEPGYTNNADKGSPNSHDEVVLDAPTHHKERKRIRTNFRPVQALNDRAVYRSFEDFSGGRKCSGSNNISPSLSLTQFLLFSLLLHMLSNL